MGVKMRSLGLICAVGATIAGCSSGPTPLPADDDPTTGDGTAPTAYDLLMQDILINADYWEMEPRIMGAGLGFTGINGIPGLTVDDLELTKNLAQLAGASWSTPKCGADEVPTLANYTSAATPENIQTGFGALTYYADGYPMEFSWPVLPATVDPTDFELTLNTGAKVMPLVASIIPNSEYNERTTVVIFGYFGNRMAPESDGLVWPVSIEIVEDDTPLTLVGPGGRMVVAVGMTKDSPPPSSYTDPDAAPEDRGGPTLLAGKLSRMSDVGDNAPVFLRGNLPNHGIALYGDDAQYRVRVVTSGGMTPDSVTGLKPTDFEKYFRLRAENDAGDDVILTETDVDYMIDGYRVRILGLADIGKKQDEYTDCYADDKDNYIDVILNGDEEAMRRITHLEIPSTGDYGWLVNPGGPGNDPFPDVLYTAGTPPISQELTIAIDNPMTVTYIAPGATQ